MQAAALLATGLSCGGHPALPVGAKTPATYWTSQVTDTRFHTAEHFLASIEMQLSGEPFAQLLGRNLAGFLRFNKVPDIYVDSTIPARTVDPLSYSMAVESYEYSKQPMNNTSFESGAGLSLAFGPLLNPAGSDGDAAVSLLRARLGKLATASGAGGDAGTNWVVTPAPTDNPLNVYGWPGYWPVFAEWKSFAPDISPAGGATHGCSFTFGYGMAPGTSVGDYECGYNSLNLPHRDAQVEKVLDPAGLGYALWKQSLWVINYWQSMHDLAGNPILSVEPADLVKVGQPFNEVIGLTPDPSDPTGKKMMSGSLGTYLGDVPLEGWQGLTMLDEADNKSAMTLTRLLTSDGAKLGGFASVGEALAYDYLVPTRWWPSAIGVVEVGAAPPAGQSWKDFPRPTGFSIEASSSRLLGLSALAGGFATVYALTDEKNAGVGGQASARATFDGDPFAADNQIADGEATLHDRALANIKVAIIDMDRIHFDPKRRVLVDEATWSAGAFVRGGTVTTVDAAYTIVALRTALRSISSTLSLYSNDTPDSAGLPTALDGTPTAGAASPLPARMRALIAAEADFIVNQLVNKDGSVANAFDLGTGASDPAPSRIESEAAAVRGLLDAYLATSDARYREAAMRVWADLERRFWMRDVRAYRTTASVSDTLSWSPVSFGALQGALRQYWKLVGRRPGNEVLGAEILERVQRMNKLVANGWDDANADNLVQFPSECTGGGLQMAERALSGELSHASDAGDRDHDCVREISVAQLPSALAAKVVFLRR